MHTPQNDSLTYDLPTDSSLHDSLAQYSVKEAPDTLTAYPSLISSTVLNDSLEAKPLATNTQPFWVPGILLMSFIMVAWVKLFFRRRLEMIFRAVFARNYANQLVREGNLFNERTGLILFIVYLLVMAMMAFQTLRYFNALPEIKPWIIYAGLMGVFLGLWILKLIIVRMLSSLFNTVEHSRSLQANMLLYNLFIGIVLLPIVCGMAYAHTEAFFYIGLVIITLTYILRIIREALIGFNIIKFSVFHLILYLCTLEILPLIVLAKILTRNMNL